MPIKKDDNSLAGNAARANIAKQQREHRRANRGISDPANWGTANPALIAEAITALTNIGCAVQFGYTKDNGAFVVRIVGDGEPYNEYVRPTEDIDKYLISLAADYAK